MIDFILSFSQDKRLSNKKKVSKMLLYKHLMKLKFFNKKKINIRDVN